MQSYREENWQFLNMNSPADLYAEYQEETVSVSEYDRCRDGHGLVSRFYVDEEDVLFQTQVCSIGAGIGMGLYLGDGCFDHYCMIVADCEGISIRIPNGVPNGDTFRMDGPKRYYSVGAQKVRIKEAFLLTFQKKQDRVTVWLDGTEVLSQDGVYLPHKGYPNGRLILKAMNEHGSKPREWAVFGKYMVNGQLTNYPVRGRCMDPVNGQGLAGVYLHICGDFHTWCRTDEDGSFSMPPLPYGDYRIIMGMEEKQFISSPITHDGSRHNIPVSFAGKNRREDQPQEELASNLAYEGLNGIWKFEFDKENTGEQEGWFWPGRHLFSKCIQVPFSWQSLMAFGEEEMADAYSLHQANTFTCNARETGETGWYQRSIRVSWRNPELETELVFAAVAGISKVWLDQEEIGCIVDSYNKHVFRLGRLIPEKEYTLTVMVQYEHGNHWACSGKQGFWFTDAPGIWQNVWLRERQSAAVTDILVASQSGHVDIRIVLDGSGKPIAQGQCSGSRIILEVPVPAYYSVDIYYRSPVENPAAVFINGGSSGIKTVFDAVHGKGIYDKKQLNLYLNAGRQILEFTGGEELDILKADLRILHLTGMAELYLEEKLLACLPPAVNRETGLVEMRYCGQVADVKPWSPECPNQYELRAVVKMAGEHAEYRRSFGIREIGTTIDADGTGRYITVNRQKIYIRGVMDQGYNPWGIYTYPRITGTVPGSMEFDILAAKQCGYNLIRMHIKDNEPDWYQICDRTGMLVWDELPANFYGVAHDRHWQGMYKRQLRQMIRKHNYHPSVILFSAINESWGLTGDHERSPWEEAEGQRLIREYAQVYKQQCGQVLVIDNSGYGKTSETQIIDYHSYPGGFQEARSFFGKLAKQNKQGSCFNFYNEKNRELMQDEGIRSLLQGNCAQDLSRLNYLGAEEQGLQPVLISEFVHTDKQEELVRIFPEFAGYIRMNIASQENEDTSPLTAVRTWRSFGYVNADLSPATYRMANSENLIFLDYPFLSQKTEGEEVHIPVYLSIWEQEWRGAAAVEWKIIGIDFQGRYRETSWQGRLEGCTIKEKPYCFGEIRLTIPKGWKAAYLFASLQDDGREAALTYLQFEIFPREADFYQPSENMMEILPRHLLPVKGFWYSGQYLDSGRCLVWGYGQGEICYRMEAPDIRWSQAKLFLELSLCTCIQGTRETDEMLLEGQAEIYINQCFLCTVELIGQPSDRRGLFSNSSMGSGEIVKYSSWGRYGYGYRVEQEFTGEIIERIRAEKIISVAIKASKEGIVIYGNRMGRYGCNPMILLG